MARPSGGGWILSLISLFSLLLFPCYGRIFSLIFSLLRFPPFCLKLLRWRHFLEKSKTKCEAFSLPAGKTPDTKTAYEALSPRGLSMPSTPATIFTRSGAPLGPGRSPRLSAQRLGDEQAA